MRPRTGITVASALLALVLGIIARQADVEPLEPISGVLWLIALIGAISLLPFWAKVLPHVPPMSGLFTPVAKGQRWCTRCGTPAGRGTACEVCGHEPTPRGRRAKGG